MEPEIWRCKTCGPAWAIAVRAVPPEPSDARKRLVSCVCGQPFFLVGRRDVVTRVPVDAGLAWGLGAMRP